MLERYLIPLAPYALLALAAIGGLLLAVSFEREIRGLKARLRGQANGEFVSQKDLQIKLDKLAARLRDAEERASAAPPGPPLKPGLNLNRRTQVIRMSRRGAPAAQIAASLNLPLKEVELLLKIHNLTLAKSAEATS